MKDSNVNSVRIGFLSLLCVLLSGLKLAGVISPYWWSVLSPILISWVAILLVIALCLISRRLKKGGKER